MPSEDSKANCVLVDCLQDSVLFGRRDGTLSKYNLSSGAPLEHTKQHLDGITQLASRDGFLLSCSEDGFVYKHEITSLSNVDLLQRLAAPIRTIDIAADGRLFLIAGDQMDLCIANYADPIDMVQLEGHKHAILSGRFDPTGNWIATLSQDKNCFIWKHDATADKWDIHQKISVDMNESRISNSALTLAWNPTQPAVVAIPSEKSVLLYNIIQQTNVNKVQIPRLKGHAQYLNFSPNGNYLAIGSDSQMFIYNLCIKKLSLLKEFPGKAIIGVCWKNEDFCCVGLDNCSFEVLAIDSLEASVDVPVEQPAKKPAPSFDEDSLEDLIEKMAQDDDEETTKDSTENTSVAPQCHSTQATFMPNVTPFVHNYRYLAWNGIGFVLCRQDESKSKIDVEFFEAEKYRPIRFIDTNGLSMASLGTKGVLLASEYFDESNPSVIKFIPYESWASNSDWTYTLPAGESVSLIAMAKKWAVIFFASNRIAIYSLNGLLRVEFQWPCVHPISMCAFESEFMLFWIDSNGSTMFTLFDVETNQIIHSGIFSCRTTTSINWVGYSEVGIPLCYLDDGCLYGFMRGCYASWVMLLDCHELRTEKNENYWPITVTFDNVLLYCSCYGGETFPNPSKKMRTVSELPLAPQSTIPLNDTESSLFLMQLMRDYHTYPTGFVLDEERQSFIDAADYQIDKQLLELIMTALSANKQAKAIELVSLLTLESSFQKAIRLCQHYKFHDLADKVDLIRERTFQSTHNNREIEDDASQMPLFENDSPSLNVAQSSYVTVSSPKSPLKPVLVTNLHNGQGLDAIPQSYVPKSKNPFQR